MKSEHACPAPGMAGRQSRLMSLAEAIANIVVGYGVAVLTQVLVFPFFGLRVTLGDSLMIGMVFTAVSIVRGYLLRRLFERIRLRGLQRETAALWRAAAVAGLWVGQAPMR